MELAHLSLNLFIRMDSHLAELAESAEGCISG